jgi:hypothetical protein
MQRLVPSLLRRPRGRRRELLEIGDATFTYEDAKELDGVIRERIPPLIREIFPNPFHPHIVDPVWSAGVIPGLARSIDDDAGFDRLPILGDALEEAGCTDRAILDHCRGPGPHVRGCWVVDLVLGNE